MPDLTDSELRASEHECNAVAWDHFADAYAALADADEVRAQRWELDSCPEHAAQCRMRAIENWKRAQQDRARARQERKNRDEAMK